MPKTYKNLLKQIYSLDNLYKAVDKAANGRHNKYAVKQTLKDLDNKVLKIQKMLISGEYKTSTYDIFKIYEPKEREIYRLPFFPDRIVHHAFMNILEPIWVKMFIKTTYSCIKGRGIHKAVEQIQHDLRADPEGTVYCLKLDIKKFYPSIDHDILKTIIRHKISDEDFLKIIDEIIDSADGVPIGNYLSQYFANLYLTYFDHWIKEVLKVKYYYRYADDIVIFCSNKEQLHEWFKLIQNYLKENLKLTVKFNYQVFPVDDRGLDFVGYVFRHNYTLVRKSIKKNILHQVKNRKIEYSYLGWLKYCDSKLLLYRIEQKTGIHFSNWRGKQVTYKWLQGKIICIVHVEDRKSYFIIQFIYKGKPYYYKSKNKRLRNAIRIAEANYKRGTNTIPIFR